MKKYIRKVTKVGGKSLSVVIPAEICDELKIRERQKLGAKDYLVKSDISISDVVKKIKEVIAVNHK